MHQWKTRICFVILGLIHRAWPSVKHRFIPLTSHLIARLNFFWINIRGGWVTLFLKNLTHTYRYTHTNAGNAYTQHVDTQRAPFIRRMSNLHLLAQLLTIYGIMCCWVAEGEKKKFFFGDSRHRQQNKNHLAKSGRQMWILCNECSPHAAVANTLFLAARTRISKNIGLRVV